MISSGAGLWQRVFLLMSCTILTSVVDAIVPISNFYPFGTEHGDNVVPVNDDASTGRIPLSMKFPFFGVYYSSMWVNTNGALSFGAQISSYQPQPFPLPAHYSMVAPYWTDIDTTRNSGRVYYQEVINGTLLNRATADVRNYFPGFNRFLATWVFISTWYNVTCYGCTPPNQPIVTFQCILVTNGAYSFTFFLYNELQWEHGTASEVPAQVGFNAGDGIHFLALNQSRTADIVKIVNESNIEQPGIFVFRIDNETIISGGCNSINGSSVFFSPGYVNMLGQQQLLIKGACFTSTTNITCIFHDPSVPEPVTVSGAVLDENTGTCFTPTLFAKGRIAVDMIVSDANNSVHHSGILTVLSFEDLPPAVTLRNGTVPINTVLDLSSDTSVTISWNPGDLVGASMVQIQIFIYDTTTDGGRISQSFDPVLTITSSTDNTGMYQFIPSSLSNLPSSRPSGSGAVAVSPVLSRTSAIDMPQGALLTGTLWSAVLFTIYEGIQIYSGQKCLDWYSSDPGVDISTLQPCPPTEQVALNNQCGFMPDDGCTQNPKWYNFYNCRFHNGKGANGFECTPDFCIRSGANGASCPTAGQQCCYKDGNLLVEPPCAGTADFSSTECGIFQHFMHDVWPAMLCCELVKESLQQEMCAKYYERRPADDGSQWQPCGTGNGNGDPHLTTFDQLKYTFNGAGEFWMVSSAAFKMQVRMQPYTINGISKPASIFTAAAMQAHGSEVVQVELDTLRRANVLASGVLMDFSEDVLLFQPLRGAQILVDKNMTLVTVQFRAGVTAFVNVYDDSLAFSFTVSNSFKGKTKGLMGNFNNNSTDDLMLPNGTVISPNSSLNDIHHNFGLKWYTTEADSMFTYSPGTNYSTYYKPDFKPNFTRPDPHSVSPEIQALCGTTEECIYDALTTGNLDFARNTLQAVTNYTDSRNTLMTKTVVCPHLKTPADGSQANPNPYAFEPGSIAVFACNSGYQLTGDKELVCKADGTWNGTIPVCSQVMEHSTPMKVTTINTTNAPSQESTTNKQNTVTATTPPSNGGVAMVELIYSKNSGVAVVVAVVVEMVVFIAAGS